MTKYRIVNICGYFYVEEKGLIWSLGSDTGAPKGWYRFEESFTDIKKAERFAERVSAYKSGGRIVKELEL